MKMTMNAAAGEACDQNPLDTVSVDTLSELGRATTAYFEAAPERVEGARLEYMEALRIFNSTQIIDREPR